MKRRAFNSLPHGRATRRPARRASMAQSVSWLVWLALAGMLAGGCAGWQGDQPGPAGAGERPFVRQLSVTETTVLSLEDGWGVGLEWVSLGQYLDDQGRERSGLMARISVGNDALEPAETIEVRVGTVFQAGDQRYQVLRLKPNTSLRRAPGSSNGYMVFGQLEADPVGMPEAGGMGLTIGAVERLFEDGAAHTYRQAGSETVDLYCHVVEGAWCYFVPQGRIESFDGLYDPQIENEAHRIGSDFARQITHELGVEYLAQSRNNGVKVRCARSENTRLPVACQVDRGGGWQDLPVLSQSVRTPASGDRITAQPLLIDSPQQDRTLVITVNTDRSDPTQYLTLVFEVRDKATQAILHRQQTNASSRMTWSMRWPDNGVVQLISSDVGTFCWQEYPDGTWSEAECP